MGSLTSQRQKPPNSTSAKFSDIYRAIWCRSHLSGIFHSGRYLYNLTALDTHEPAAMEVSQIRVAVQPGYNVGREIFIIVQKTLRFLGFIEWHVPELLVFRIGERQNTVVRSRHRDQTLGELGNIHDRTIW